MRQIEKTHVTIALYAVVLLSVGLTVALVAFAGQPSKRTNPARPTVVAAHLAPIEEQTPAAPEPATPRPAEALLVPTSPPAAAPTMLPLLGRRIGIDPGHGPRDDLGAVALDPQTGGILITESEINLDIALRLRTLLVQRGASVVLTRETANTFTAPWPADVNNDGIVGGPGDDLQERVDILNNFKAEVFVSLHTNSTTNPDENGGIEAIYCATSDCPFPKQDMRLGEIVLAHLTTQLASIGYKVPHTLLLSDLSPDSTDGTPQHLFVLGPANPPRHPRAIQMPGVVAEALYLTSPEEVSLLQKPSVRQAIALAYADALQEYLTE